MSEEDILTAQGEGPQITVVRWGSVHLVQASGGLDSAHAASWKRSLTDTIGSVPPHVTGVVVDLTRVTLLSAAATWSLMAAAAAVPEGVRLVVVARDLVRQVLRIVDHTGRLTVIGELGAALANLGAAG